MSTRNVIIAFTTAAAIATGSFALAGNKKHAEENDAQAVHQAKISLTQAIAAAEHHTPGRSAKAEFEHSGGKAVFDVEVVAGSKVMDIKVDAMSGKVIAATEDRADHNDGQDKED